MGVFGRRVEEVVEEEWKPTPGDRYEGQHAFSDGFYYVVKNDEWGNEVGPDWDMRLVWHEAGYLVHAAPTDSNHFHTYGLNTVELTPEVS